MKDYSRLDDGVADSQCQEHAWAPGTSVNTWNLLVRPVFSARAAEPRLGKTAPEAGALPIQPRKRAEAEHRKSYYRNDTKTH